MSPIPTSFAFSFIVFYFAYNFHFLLCSFNTTHLLTSYCSSLASVSQCPLPSHVNVLAYSTGLKFSVSWGITLCLVCPARLSSHWLVTLNGPTHVWREPKLSSCMVRGGCQCYLTWSLCHPSLPFLSSVHTHAVSSCPVVSGHLIPELDAGALLLSLSNPLKVIGSDTQDRLKCCWRLWSARQHLHTKPDSVWGLLFHYSSWTNFHTLTWEEGMRKWQKAAGLAETVRKCDCDGQGKGTFIIILLGDGGLF